MDVSSGNGSDADLSESESVDQVLLERSKLCAK